MLLKIGKSKKNIKITGTEYKKGVKSPDILFVFNQINLQL